jgi:glycosyltransferase involved in cell wall biosynthesis
MRTPCLVSVVIPCYNGAAYLEEAIESVLTQDYVPLELIVVDDGSEDESAAVACQYPEVRLLSKPHSGVGATLNVGVRYASGDLLAFLDADDRWLPGKLALQAQVLKGDPGVDMVFGHIRQFQQSGRSGDAEILLGTQPGVAKSSLLIRRNTFLQVGCFTEDPALHDFIDWYARALEVGLRACVLPDTVAERRIHDHNMGRRETEAQRQRYLNTVRATMARRKARAFGVQATPSDVS